MTACGRFSLLELGVLSVLAAVVNVSRFETNDVLDVWRRGEDDTFPKLSAHEPGPPEVDLAVWSVFLFPSADHLRRQEFGARR